MVPKPSCFLLEPCLSVFLGNVKQRFSPRTRPCARLLLCTFEAWHWVHWHECCPSTRLLSSLVEVLSPVLGAQDLTNIFSMSTCPSLFLCCFTSYHAPTRPTTHLGTLIALYCQQHRAGASINGTDFNLIQLHLYIFCLEAVGGHSLLHQLPKHTVGHQ